MQRRELIKRLIGAATLPWSLPGVRARAAQSLVATSRLERCRPASPRWPNAAEWARLNRRVHGRLLSPRSPFSGDDAAESSAASREALAALKNPFYLGDQVALTETSGWAGAWTSRPSAYAVAAESTADVVAAVNFAREHALRLVVKGGGHSYQGTSCAADSLLVWMRRLNGVELHDDFVPAGCRAGAAPQPAVSIGGGALWIDAYAAVTTGAGRYVQGGGCTSVGVAGLLQGGGFGSYSKQYGIAAAGLLEAQVVTADGNVRLANACRNPDLFWALKGGGGGTFGVITRATLRTRELPDTFGAASGAIRASTDAAYRALIGKALGFYASALCNPHWGEQMNFRTDNTLRIAMVFQGLSQQQASAVWTPFVDWVRAQPELTFATELQVLGMPARHGWDAQFFRQHAPKFIVTDDRPEAPAHRFLWAGDQEQAGWQINGYKSAWLDADLLAEPRAALLADAIFNCTRHWELGLHFNKGLAGAPPEEIEAARNTAMNPAVLTAFALAIIAAGGPPAFPGMPGGEPDLPAARAVAQRIEQAMNEMQRIAPSPGSYVAESDFFEGDWRNAFWGTHYPRLARIKRQYDPDGLFFVHHGVGSEAWSADGFTPA
jgi:FAD/FMN-containing dehydrogenase